MARKTKPAKRPRKADIKAAADRADKRSKGEEIVEPSVPIDPVILKAEFLMGRPTLYKPEYAAVAKALCKRGATDHDLAEEFGVTTVTIWRWQSKYEDFCNAVQVHKGMYDDRVKRSLAMRAIGYSYNTQKVFNDKGSIVRADIVEHVPPDVGAAKLWLTNRCQDEWRERKEVTGADGAPLLGEQTDRMQLARWIAFELANASNVLTLEAAPASD